MEKVFRAVSETLGENILCTPENCLFLTYVEVHCCIKWDGILQDAGAK